MCEQNVVTKMTIEAAPRPRFQVTANKSIYFSASFDEVEDAVQEAARLVREGFAVVAVRDAENDGDIW